MEQLYRMHLALLESDPLIWRQLQVPGSMSLHTLHRVLQVVMGWETYHLYEFIVADHHYSEPSPEWAEYDLVMENSRAVRLEMLLFGPDQRLRYVYDFGDNWEHELVVEEVVSTRAAVRAAICLDGAYAGPPEDCGGVHGYAEMLEVLTDPSHEEYESWVTWLGDRIDRETFDLDAVNRRLQGIKASKRNTSEHPAR